MKKLIYILLLSTTLFCSAQEAIIPIENINSSLLSENEDLIYFKDVNNVLDKFEGTWRYTDGAKIFEITFTKRLHYDYLEMSSWGPGNKNYDLLISKFQYSDGGVLIYETDPAISLWPSHTISPLMISGYLVSQNNLNKLRISYDEPSLSQSRASQAHLTIEYDDTNMLPDGSGVNLIWNRVYEKRYTFFQYGADMSDFVIPANMVLIKQ